MEAQTAGQQGLPQPEEPSEELCGKSAALHPIGRVSGSTCATHQSVSGGPHHVSRIQVSLPSSRTHKGNLEILSECVGKVDGYTNVQGLDSARQAVVDTFKSKNHALTKDDVYLTAGGSMALWSVISLLAGPGDNFLFPSPGFPLALTIAKSMDIEPRFYHLQADNKWQANLEEI